MLADELDLQELEFENPLEEEIEHVDVPASKRRIYADQADREVDALYRKFKKGTLNIQPDFQRQFVWDAKKCSRLIESALLDIPLPVIYLSEESDNKEHVIDGQQRLTAFFSFIEGKFPDGTPFRLSDVKLFPELRGRFYRDLPEELQDKITSSTIRTIAFRSNTDSDLKFEIFERLNTGSVALNDQELRNCIYRGNYNHLLKRLSEDADFRYLLSLKTADKRMKDIELVLRFAAFYHSAYLNYKPPMRRFLNQDMEQYQNLSEAQAAELKQAFKNAVHLSRSVFDTNAFKRFYRGTDKNPNGSWERKKFNASLYDITMGLFARADKNKVMHNLDAIREAFLHLMTEDQEFIDAIELSTSSVQAVTKRFDKWRFALEGCIGIAQKEPRCFSLKLKEELYELDPTCQICGNRIHSVDDAAIDHIDQYWRGGQTIAENARLAHRFCNWSRPRND